MFKIHNETIEIIKFPKGELLEYNFKNTLLKSTIDSIEFWSRRSSYKSNMWVIKKHEQLVVELFEEKFHSTNSLEIFINKHYLKQESFSWKKEGF